MSNDVSRAFVYAPTSRPIHIAILEKDREPGDSGKVAKLNLPHGTRDAAMNWIKKFTDVMWPWICEGLASPSNCFNPSRHVSVTVHRGDFACKGRLTDLL